MRRYTRAVITRHAAVQTCAICERTLLMGERPTRFSPGGDDDYVDVCPLCQDAAYGHGWVKEGSPTTPTVPVERRRRPSLARLFPGRRTAERDPVVSEPILRRLSEPELAIVDAADVFNASDYRRTIGGIAKSLGKPKVSLVHLSGLNPELVITVCWDISWYQYRVSTDAAQPVRLTGRGYDPGELDPSFTVWNAHIEDGGRVVPEISPV